MKRTLAALLAGVMALSVAGCGSSKTNETTAAETTETETTADSESATNPDYVSAFDLGDISDYVELGEYKGIQVTAEDTTVSDEDVESELQSLVDNATAKYEEITEGTVADGDVVNIDYVGKMNGEEFDGGSDSNFNLTIGSGQFIDGFESGLIGANIGDTVTLDLTFPEDYSTTNTELNGAAVQFDVTINYVQGDEIEQELNDEFIQEYTSGEYTTVDDYRAYMRSDLEATAQETAKETEINAAWEIIKSNATFKKDPEKLVSYLYDYQMYQLDSMLTTYGVTMDDYLEQMGYTEDSLKEEVTEYCEDTAKTQLLIRAIIEKEGLDLSDEDYETRLAALAEDNSTTADNLKSAYTETYLKDILRTQIIQDFVDENTVRVEGTTDTTAAEETGAATE